MTKMKSFVESSKRALKAPWLWIGLWLSQVLFAYLASRFVASSVTAAIAGRGFLWLDDGHKLGALAELFADNPAVSGALVTSVFVSLTVGAVFWIFAAGAVFERLGGRARGSATLAAGGRWAWPVLGLTLWSLLVRGLLLLVGFLLTKLWEPLGLLLPLWFVLGVLAFDEARARVILEGQRAAHPRTSFGAVLAVGRRPLLVLGALLVTLAAWGLLALGVVWAGQAAFGSATLLAVRGLSLLALGLGLLRVSWVIGARGQADPASTPTAAPAPGRGPTGTVLQVGG